MINKLILIHKDGSKDTCEYAGFKELLVVAAEIIALSILSEDFEWSVDTVISGDAIIKHYSDLQPIPTGYGYKLQIQMSTPAGPGFANFHILPDLQKHTCKVTPY